MLASVLSRTSAFGDQSQYSALSLAAFLVFTQFVPKKLRRDNEMKTEDCFGLLAVTLLLDYLSRPNTCDNES
jgi:hypothetical protein